MDAAVLEREVSTLQADIASHNRAIRRHRKERAEAVTKLERLAADCRYLGITLVIEPQHSKGAVHGRTDRTE